MSTTGSLRIVRPYGSAEDYLAGDAWTVDRTEMLLVDAEPVVSGTFVKFEIALATGDAVVRGEGRALDPVPAQDGRPGGLRVRFRQLDASSKAMLRRALDVQKRAAAERGAQADASPPEEVPPSRKAEAGAPIATPDVGTPESHAERSGVRHRATLPIVAPGNRDALLARLRERAPRAPRIDEAAPKRRTANE